MTKPTEVKVKEQETTSSFFKQLESMTEAELQNIYDILSIDRDSLSRKQKIELFWIGDKLVDLDDKARKELWYDILDIDESDVYEGD